MKTYILHLLHGLQPCPLTAPKTPLFLACGYLQVWCMCYFYNTETIQLFKTPKAENEWPNSEGKNIVEKGKKAR